MLKTILPVPASWLAAQRARSALLLRGTYGARLRCALRRGASATRSVAFKAPKRDGSAWLRSL